MTQLRAADVKDEHGWQVYDGDELVGHATSRDKARTYVKHSGSENMATICGFAPAANGTTPEWKEPPPLSPEQQAQVGQVLPADNSPEALAGRAAWDVDQKIKAALRTIKGTWIDLAGHLYVFHENKMWESLGYESWTAYFADPEIDLDPRWAYDQLAVYKQLVVDRGVDPDRLRELHASKVTKILPAVRRDQVTVEEALSDVKVLSRSDLEGKYSGRFQPQKSRRGQPDTSSTVHTDSEPVWAVCPTCSSRYRVDPETGERVNP